MLNGYKNYFIFQQQTDLENEVNGSSAQTTTSAAASITTTATTDATKVNQPKRLHVSNIPFRFRDPDLRQLFGVISFSIFL